MTPKDRTIIRCPKNSESPYFSISRALAQDRSLSWEARGLMLYLLSKPDDWIVQVNDLRQNCGRDKVYKLLEELCNARYMARSEKPGHGEKGKLTHYEYTIFEQPYTENPYTVLPYTAKPTLQNIDTTEKRIDTTAPDGTGSASKPERPRNPWYDVVFDIWHYTASLNGVMAQFLQGKAKQKGYKEYNLTRAITPEQVYEWAAWYRREKLHGDKKLSMIAEPIKVQSSIYEWLDLQQNQPPKQAVIIPYDELTAPSSADFRVYDTDGTYLGMGAEGLKRKAELEAERAMGEAG